MQRFSARRVGSADLAAACIMVDLSLATAVVLSSVWLGCVNHKVLEPYMDEVFHVGQTQTYLAGNWTEWDPKITTPPGLYGVGVVAGRALEALSIWNGRHETLVCALRGLSVAFYGSLIAMVLRLAKIPLQLCTCWTC